MIGHDIDQAIKNGLTRILSRAESLVCLQHVSERGSKKLDKILASTSDKKRILCDIYGSKKKASFYSLVLLMLWMFPTSTLS